MKKKIISNIENVIAVTEKYRPFSFSLIFNKENIPKIILAIVNTNQNPVNKINANPIIIVTKANIENVLKFLFIFILLYY